MTVPATLTDPHSSTSLLIANCAAPPVPTMLVKFSLVPPVMVTVLLMDGTLVAVEPVVISIQFGSAFHRPPYGFTQR